MKSVLLTGATGVLGAGILKELLQSTPHSISCLIRAGSVEEGKNRLQSILRTYDPENHLEAEFHRRVRVIIGDVAAPQFGIPALEYQRLADTIDATLHAASCTNLFLNLRRIEPINVGGTRNVIQFALDTACRDLTYISTYTVMGSKVFDPTLTFSEKDLDLGQTFEWMTYQQTKFTAEKMIREAGIPIQEGGKGLLWNIIRPGQIFGEASTGYYPIGQTNISGLFLDIFKTIIETGIAFQSRTHYDVAPVDFVSRACVYLGLERKNRSETYHLLNPDTKTYSEVVKLVSSIGYPIRSIPQSDYKNMLLDQKLISGGREYKSSTTQALKWWLQREPFDFAQSAMTDCTYTYGILEAHGITCPKLDQNLISVYIEDGIRKGFFPRPKIRSFYDEVVGVG